MHQLIRFMGDFSLNSCLSKQIILGHQVSCHQVKSLVKSQNLLVIVEYVIVWYKILTRIFAVILKWIDKVFFFEKNSIMHALKTEFYNNQLTKTLILCPDSSKNWLLIIFKTVWPFFSNQDNIWEPALSLFTAKRKQLASHYLFIFVILPAQAKNRGIGK